MENNAPVFLLASSLPVFTKFAVSLEQFRIAFASLGLVIFHFGLAEANEATVVKEERD
jgi:hypothetical protein